MTLKFLLKFLLLALLLTLYSYCYFWDFNNLPHLQKHIVLLIFAYAIGSIPTGYLLHRLFTGHDIRATGSGGIGATNVLRTGNKPLAIATLMGDALKGYLAVLLPAFFPASDLHWSMPFMAGASAILAHMYPVWLDLKGGKGVATGIGVVSALSWITALSALGIWLVTARLTRYSSLSSLVAVFTSPLVALSLGDSHLAGFLAVIGTLIILSHWSNIRRLLHGQEPKIGQKIT